MSKHGGWAGMALKKNPKKPQGTVIHRALARSFTSTLYSLDVVTVNLSISFPGFKKAAYKEGHESSERVHSVRSAPPSPLQPGARPSSHQHKIPTVWSYLLLSFSTTPFIFQSKKIFPWICFFRAHLSLSLPLSFIPLSLSTGTGTRVFFSSYFVLNYYYFP